MNKLKLLILSFFISSAFMLFLNSQTVSPRVLDGIAETQFWTQKESTKGIFEGIILGDSRTFIGIDPEQDPQKRNIYNFGYKSAGLSVDYIDYHLKKYTNGPSILILGISAHTFTKEAFKNSHFKELQMKAADIKFYESSFLAQKLFAPFSQKQFKSNDFPKNINIFNYQTGWVAVDRKSPDTQEGLDTYSAIFKKYSFDKDLVDITANYLKKLKNITVYAVRLPTSEAMESLEEDLGKFDFQYTHQKLKEAGVNWIEIPKNSMKLNTYDGSHLTSESAKRLSEFLFTKI